ncbi:Bax inhibitor-1/YccA family protein [Anaeromicropila herbilytica]|uniref:Inner membrane protein YbhL n=1 Tax=Anaeromicropila herbilytica TaxID=2785025 RepID=A0A7R7EKG3_9FIRM|nr:Bax inhibitor-1/YccA family protein [Anaeromicropila herbilytica]BCN30417.1 inner membrane protein YbhL [Anaeromicropila herbilytica]
MDDNFNKNQDQMNQNYHTYNSDNGNYQNYGYSDAYGNSYQSSQSALDLEAKVQGVISKTFLFMFMVLLVTAASAYMTYSTGVGLNLLRNGMMTPILVAEVAVVLLANATLRRNNAILSSIMLFVYSVVNGITLSTVFYVYEITSIISIFVIAAVVFGCMATYGLVTKKDLTALGTIGMMGLVGVIVLGIVNIFLHSNTLGLGIAAVGLAIFIGLTAYDLQKLKNIARSNIGMSETSLALYGALVLYLDFINIFLQLLRLFGRARD